MKAMGSFKVGLIAAAVLTVTAAVVLSSGISGAPGIPVPWNHAQVIHIQLRSSDTLEPNAAVDVAGVKVGVVKNIAVNGNYADVAVQIDDPSVASVRSDAKAALRIHGLLGGEYVAIEPGHASQAMPDGGTISVDRTQQPVDLDQVLGALQAPEAANLRTALVELGTAAAGRGQDVNNLLASSKALTAALQTPLQTVDSVAPNINEMLIQDEAFNADFSQTPLDQLVANSNRTLQAFAANSDHLQNVLVNANADFGELNVALSGQGGRDGNLSKIIEDLGRQDGVLNRLQTFSSSLNLFSRNIQGQDSSMPQDGDVTNGIISAVENPKSAFSSYDCNNPTENPCPPADRDYYLRVQVFNFANTGDIFGAPPPTSPQGTSLPLCSLNILTLPGTPSVCSGATTPPGIVPSGIVQRLSQLAYFLNS